MSDPTSMVPNLGDSDEDRARKRAARRAYFADKRIPNEPTHVGGLVAALVETLAVSGDLKSDLIAPRQCAAFDTAVDGQCGRDTFTLIELGLADQPNPDQWSIHVEVPVCDQHQALLTAIEEEAEPAYNVAVGQLPADYVVLPTLRISVGEV